MNQFAPIEFETFKGWGVGNDPFLSVSKEFNPKTKRRKKMSEKTYQRLVGREKARWDEELQKKIHKAIEQGYEYYKSSGAGFCKVLGTGDSLKNDSALRDNFRVINKGGALLIMKKWSIFYNDAAILGAIHAKQIVYINCQLSMIPKESLFDFEKGRPTLLGREIIMLSAAGYRPAERRFDEKLGTALLLPKSEDPNSVTLPFLRKKADAVKEFSEIPFVS